MLPVLGPPAISCFSVAALEQYNSAVMFGLETHHGNNSVNVFVDEVELGIHFSLAHNALYLATVAKGSPSLNADVALFVPSQFIFTIE